MQTILLQNMYQNPNNQTQNPGGQPVVSPEEEQRHFDEFFEVFLRGLEEVKGDGEQVQQPTLQIVVFVLGNEGLLIHLTPFSLSLSLSLTNSLTLFPSHFADFRMCSLSVKIATAQLKRWTFATT